jgi:hypothetical protein
LPSPTAQTKPYGINKSLHPTRFPCTIINVKIAQPIYAKLESDKQLFIKVVDASSVLLPSPDGTTRVVCGYVNYPRGLRFCPDQCQQT